MFFISYSFVSLLVLIDLTGCQLQQQLFDGRKELRDEYKLTYDGLTLVNPGKHNYGRSYALTKSTTTPNSIIEQVFAGIFI